MNQRNRKGQEESGITVLELLLVMAFVLLALLAGFRVYNALFGPDPEALNTYELIGDNMESLLAVSDAEKTLTFLFTFHLENNGKIVNVLKERDAYKGTIFGVSSDGHVTHPFPATVMAPGQLVLDGLVERAKLPKPCRKSACLCFSKRVLEPGATEEEKRRLLTHVVKCRRLPGTITFDFTQPQVTLPEGEYPHVHITKLSTGDATTLKLRLGAIN